MSDTKPIELGTPKAKFTDGNYPYASITAENYPADARVVKMRPEIKLLWLEALRGGAYEQTRSKLHDPDGGFCCLGVLCDLRMQQIGVQWDAHFNEDALAYPLGKEDHGDDNNDDDEFEEAQLPLSVAKWAGFETLQDPYLMVRGFDKPIKASQINDGCQVRRLVKAGYRDENLHWHRDEYETLVIVHPHTFAEIADLIEAQL